MKITSKLFYTLILTSIVSFSYAQDFSVFYKKEGGKAIENEKYGYDLGTNSTEKGVQQFTAIDQSNTIDVKLVFFYEAKAKKSTAFTIKIGQTKTIEFTIDIGAENAFIRENGGAKIIEYFVDGSTFSGPFYSKAVVLRIAKDYLRSITMGELGSILTSKPYMIDNRNISVSAVSSGKTYVKVGMTTEYFQKLSSFAKNGLKIRNAPNLNSKQIGSIPFGEKVYILDNANDETIDLYYNPVNTKGNLKVGKLSSKMVKIMYGNTIGYAYGGYLFPLTRKGKEYDEEYEMSFDGWTMNNISADKIFYNKKLVYWHGIIDFENDYWKGLDLSQRNFLALTLFPDALTENDIADFMEHNKMQYTTTEKDGFDVRCEVTTRRGKGAALMKIHYKMAKKGFLKSLKNHTKGYVVASNLNMRTTANTQSKILTKIPFGQKITIVDQSSSDLKVIGGVRGKMIKVTYNRQTGYVFDAYVSPIMPLKLVDPKQDIVRNFELGGKEKKWNILNSNNGGMECSVSAYSSNWLIVKSRDKFQAIKNLSAICPSINDLSFKWNSEKGAYDIKANSSKIEMTITDENWCIVVPNSKNDYERAVIMVSTLGENFHKISLATEFLGD